MTANLMVFLLGLFGMGLCMSAKPAKARAAWGGLISVVALGLVVAQWVFL